MPMLATFRRTAEGFSAHECATRAAALAYYAVFSLPPALLVIIYIVGLMYGQAAAAGQISGQLGSFVGPQAGSQIQTMIANAGSHRGSGLLSSVIAVAALVISSTTAFAELQRSLNRAWGIETDDSSFRSMAGKRISSFVIVILAGLVLMASMLFGTIVSAFGGVLSFQISGRVMLLTELLFPWIVISFIVAAIFKVLPDARIQWRDVAVGAIVSAGLLVLAKYGMSMYLTRASVANSYGAAGSLAILLLWLYVSAGILLVGAEFVQAWAHEHGRTVQPAAGAHWIGESRRAA